MFWILSELGNVGLGDDDCFRRRDWILLDEQSCINGILLWEKIRHYESNRGDGVDKLAKDED